MSISAARDGRLPDFIVIGAMKCATSSLHQYLGAHPSVAVSEPKELDFFCEPRYSSLGTEWYRQQFNDPPGALLAGESSPNYTKREEFPGVARRMHSLVPGAKLIYILRDPIKRIESHYIHSVGAGKWRDSFDAAVCDPANSPMVQASCYWTQLGEFLELYPAEQVRVLSYEQLSRQPHAVVNEVLGFLGLGTGFDDPIIGKRVHLSANKIRPNRLGLLFWDDRVWRRRLRRRIPFLVGRPIEPPVWHPDLREAVIAHLKPEVDAIREFSGLSFSEWSL